MIIDVLWIGGLVVYPLLLVNISRKQGHIDERDRLIIGKTPRAQWWAIIFSLVALLIVLSEIYHEDGLIPVIFLYLIFVSVMIVSQIAQSIGILLGYRRME